MAKKAVEPEGPWAGPLEFVERPISTRNKWPVDEVLKMLAKTLENGQAVRLPIAKVSDLAHLQMAIRYGTTKKLGAKLRYKLADQHTLIVWAEKATKVLVAALGASGIC